MARALAISDRGAPPQVQDVEIPEPGEGQARVAVHAASVNGIDGYVAAGYVWDAMPHRFPVVLGRDFAGSVDAVGPGVASVRVGDLVAGVITDVELTRGAIAQQVLASADGLVALPTAVSAAQAAAVGLAGVTAYDLVDALALTADDVVLVSGATGGVGTLAVQLAAATGARVLATARPDAAQQIRDLGADAVLDHTLDLAGAVGAVAPSGVTAVIHAAGDATVLGALLRPGGRLASVTGAMPEQVGRGDVTVIPVMAVATPDKLRGLLDAVAAGRLQVPVSQTFPLDEAASALAAFTRPKLGKLVVTVA